MKIGFIGVGNMGHPMALNLLRAGCQVKVYDVVADAASDLADEGAEVVGALQQVVSGVDTVITMLPAGEQVRAVYLGDHDGGLGILNMADSGTLFIDSSTIDPASARLVAIQAASKGVDFVDAPVSGGVAGAKAGTLTFIVGGSDANFQRAGLVLKLIGKSILHAGKAGDGQMAKICNNLMLGIQMAGVCEALSLAIDNGLDPQIVSEIMQQSSGQNWVLDRYNPCPGVMANVPASQQYQPGFMAKLMLKDLGLGLDAAVESQSPIPMGTLARNLYAFHNAASNELLDFSSLFEFYRRRSDNSKQ
ncbi:3-hydroxyisobutyrate dehydrogenase [Photobacterium aquae]|uniref:3-hydroxyisobutyrate dehydrogenase n=2 Tax=Photobacterium aquae TaxID=1195763 RepID=A0A0J1H0R7_9GAMM|nr:3-hydroxyisobutyrate dehydrogenase [Photobacterium aquae]